MMHIPNNSPIGILTRTTTSSHTPCLLLATLYGMDLMRIDGIEEGMRRKELKEALEGED